MLPCQLLFLTLECNPTPVNPVLQAGEMVGFKHTLRVCSWPFSAVQITENRAWRMAA